MTQRRRLYPWYYSYLFITFYLLLNSNFVRSSTTKKQSNNYNSYKNIIPVGFCTLHIPAVRRNPIPVVPPIQVQRGTFLNSIYNNHNSKYNHPNRLKNMFLPTSSIRSNIRSNGIVVRRCSIRMSMAMRHAFKPSSSNKNDIHYYSSDSKSTQLGLFSSAKATGGSSYRSRSASNNNNHIINTKTNTNHKNMKESSSTELFGLFQIGDDVQFYATKLEGGDNEGNSSRNNIPMIGKIVGQSRGGWYSVQTEGNDGVVKQRSSNLSLISKESNSVTSTGSDGALSNKPSEVKNNTSKVIDMDSAMENNLCNEFIDEDILAQCRHHASYKKWVVFTDLHVSSSTLETCLQVLDFVHETALRRNAGIMFLGDFWHHRGTIRIDCLNAILNKLASWSVPSIMIPGNHDQVALGGLEHGLTPLQYAYRVKDTGTGESHLGPLIFSYPTKFLYGFFVPYIRNSTKFEQIIETTEAKASSGMFVHADVIGALMNDKIISQNGLKLDIFPENIPIYSGHFHKPHNISVTKSGAVVEIKYVGSPYETALSEAGQEKSLLVLDASKEWSCIENIPIRIGCQHYRLHSLQDFLEACHKWSKFKSSEEILIDKQDVHPKNGDRVVISVDNQNLLEHRQNTTEDHIPLFDSEVLKLRNAGVKVEVRQFKRSSNLKREQENNKTLNSNEDLADNSVTGTFLRYIKFQRERESYTEGVATILSERGTLFLEETMNPDNMTDVEHLTKTKDISVSKSSKLDIDSVSVKGFGSFKNEVNYPLYGRGLVLLRGTNLDGGSDSNGSGKSTLAMAALWALTGSIDSRPVHSSRTVNIINDECEQASVSIRGNIDSIPFIITRERGAKRKHNSLTFALDGKDLTKQSMSDTQHCIDETLGVNSQVLVRSIFNGQHDMNGLLDIGDSKLKDELSLLSSLSIWQRCASLARTKARDLDNEISRIRTKAAMRESDTDKLQPKVEYSKISLNKLKIAFETQREIFQNTTSTSPRGFIDNDAEIESFQVQIKDALLDYELAEEVLKNEIKRRNEELTMLKEKKVMAEGACKEVQDSLIVISTQLTRAETQLNTTNANFEKIRRKLDDFKIKKNEKEVKVCPTCKQPLGDGSHFHSNVVDVLEQDMNDILEEKLRINTQCSNLEITRANILDTLEKKEQNLVTEKQAFDEAEKYWQQHIKVLEGRVSSSRSSHVNLTNSLSRAMKQKLDAEERQTQITGASKDLQRAKDSFNSAKRSHESLMSDLEKMKEELIKFKKEEKNAQNESAIMSKLAEAFGINGIQPFVLRSVVEDLESSSQVYLTELSDGTQKLNLSLEEGDRISRTAQVVAKDGSWTERPLASLSGGQWKRCALALTLGFLDLMAQRGCLRPSLLVLDEPLTHLDATGRSHVGSLLKQLLGPSNPDSIKNTHLNLSTILIILQDLAAEELEEAFDHIDEVKKSGGTSTVVLDSAS